MNIQREITISTLDEMCELMCGGVEDDEEEHSDLLSGETIPFDSEEMYKLMNKVIEESRKSFEEWWNRIDDTEREAYNRITEEINKC